ncbi:MAG: hypothetical protein KGZ73_06800 [Rhizobiales bacterium]|nr:hypothetical protein [Hyphomicrobiales bacterium]
MARLRTIFGASFLGRVALLLVAICFFATNVAHAASHEHSVISKVSGQDFFWENQSHGDSDAERHLAEARHCHGCFLSLIPQMDRPKYTVEGSAFFYLSLATNEAFGLRPFDSPPPK